MSVVPSPRPSKGVAMSHRFALVAAVAVALTASVLLPARVGSTEAVTGVRIVSVTATTGSKPLSPPKTNVVFASRRLGFRVTVRNPGRATLRSVRVSVAVQQTHPVRRAVTIAALAPRTSTTVVVRNFERVAYAQKLKLRVIARTPNAVSSRTYSAVIALPPP